MEELFRQVIDWYMSNINYWTIMILMAVESSFVPLPSELVIPPAAYLAVKGELNLSLIILFSTFGCILGALFNYFLAYTLGRKIIYALANSKWARVFFINQQKVENAEDYFVRNGNTSTFIGRLIPGVRHLISIPAGLSKMNISNFVIYTLVGSAIWNTTLALMSYFLIDKWEKYFHEITFGFILIGFGFIGYLVYKKYNQNKKKVTGNTPE